MARRRPGRSRRALPRLLRWTGRVLLVAAVAAGPLLLPADLWNAWSSEAIARSDRVRPPEPDERTHLRNQLTRARAEADRLRRQLDLLRDLDAPDGGIDPAGVVPAEIVGLADRSGGGRRAVIDRGRPAGVRQGLPVVAAGAIVGRVVWAGEHRALVAGVTDPSFHLGAVDERSGAPGLARGSDGSLVFRPAAPLADVEVGDAVLSAARSSAWPSGLVVGRVERVRRDGHGSIEAICRPGAPLEETRTVGVLPEGVGEEPPVVE